MLKKPSFLSYGSQLLSSPRSYATTSERSDHQWPATPSFTPYDVLNTPRNAPYVKTQYYDLVKLYHPDRPHSMVPIAITPEVRLQRYKIIVAAHEILSDPAKRTAYDISGAGWTHNRHHSFNPGGSGIYSNATWEDWERWNSRDNKQVNLVDSRTLTRLVVLLVLFGGAMQFSWISQLNTGYEDRMRDVSKDSMRFLAGRRSSTVGQMPSKDARVQSFLIRRDPSGSGLKDDEERVYRKELHPMRGAADLSAPKREE